MSKYSDYSVYGKDDTDEHTIHLTDGVFIGSFVSALYATEQVRNIVVEKLESSKKRIAELEAENKKLSSIIELMAEHIISANIGLNTEIKQFAYKSLLATGLEMVDVFGITSSNLLISDDVDFSAELEKIAKYNADKASQDD